MVFTFDVDQTLVSERRDEHSAREGDLEIMNPYTNDKCFVSPHKGHIDLLKEMFGRGRYVVVWSAAGGKWADAVVKKLNLEQYVHLVITKPLAYVDDKPVESWLNTRIYLDPNERT